MGSGSRFPFYGSSSSSLGFSLAVLFGVGAKAPAAAYRVT
jgi:hypothetical protein